MPNPFRRLPVSPLLALLGASFLLGSSCWAQQQPQSPPAAPGTPPTAQQTKQGDKNAPDEKERKNGTSDDRIFKVIPNYTTVENEHNVPPMTVGGKFKMGFQSAFDPYDYPWTAALAGLAQAQNSPKSWGQGAGAYGKRYGANFADGTIATMMTTSVFTALFREDPRYYQLGKGTFSHRVGYGISRIFVTRTDAGGSQFNYAEIVGNAVAAGLSNTYYPAEERTLPNTMMKWGLQTLYDTVFNEMKEFWPDIRRHFSKHKDQP